MSKKTKTMSYANFIKVLSTLNQRHMDVRMGQLFTILFIKGDNPDLFYVHDGIDANTMIADWMEDCQVSYGAIPIPSKNLESIKATGGDFWEVVKSHINQNESA